MKISCRRRLGFGVEEDKDQRLDASKELQGVRCGIVLGLETLFFFTLLGLEFHARVLSFFFFLLMMWCRAGT
jgi:hypothetical protein